MRPTILDDPRLEDGKMISTCHEAAHRDLQQLADCGGSPRLPKAVFGKSASCREGELTALLANSRNRP